MTAVELHTVWERFVESRLVAALNASPAVFLKTHSVRGVTRIPKGLALYVVRGGRRFLEVRSTRELLSKADDLVGESANPFSALTKTDLQYLDCLAAIRNYVVHGSDAGAAAYRANLKKCYSISSAPGPGEFLGAKDFRASSPLRYKSRVEGLIAVVKDAIERT